MSEGNDVMGELLAQMDDDAGVEREPEAEPEESVETSEPEGGDEEEETEVDAGEEDTNEDAPDEEAEDEEEADDVQGDTQAEPVSFSTSDPALLAYLARYDNDPEKALKAAVEAQRLLSRQGREKNQALARVQELETELEQQRMLDDGPAWLTEEQREYVTNAIESEQPQAWIQQAVRAGEFDLARAIADQWSEQSPYQAMRASQYVDRAEYMAAQNQQEPAAPSFDRNELLQRLAEAVPDMARYEAGMLKAMANLGDNHPLVRAARFGSENETISAVVSLYEIAKASSATVKETKQRVKQQGKDAAVAARQAAVVSSGTASPSGGQTPRKIMVAPGLSLEDLDAEFAQNST